MLMKIKMIINSRPHRPDINRPTLVGIDINILNI